MRHQKHEFGIIFNTMNQIDVVEKTLVSIMDEVRESDSVLIVHDTSLGEQRWQIRERIESMLDASQAIFIASTNVPASVSRNMCFKLLLEIANPDYICFMEDDHGFRPGFLRAAKRAIDEHHGKLMPNGLRAGLFTGCASCNHGERVYINDERDFVLTPTEPVNHLGKANACCRLARTSHWIAAIKGFDIDEYYISQFQTSGVNRRNYNLGYTSVVINDGGLMFEVEKEGRGVTSEGLRLWDNDYTASDARSSFRGKSGPTIPDAALRPKKKGLSDRLKKGGRYLVGKTK